MSWWRELFRARVVVPPYGLGASNPVLCGGGVKAEIDYLLRLRCPAGAKVRFRREGSFERPGIEHLKAPGVGLHVSPMTERRLRGICNLDPLQMPIDGYLVACDCGEHVEQIFIDMYHRGPERPIAVDGWTLIEGISPAIGVTEVAACPHCGGDLRTPKAKQCRHCKMDWHDSENVFRRS